MAELAQPRLSESGEVMLGTPLRIVDINSKKVDIPLAEPLSLSFGTIIERPSGIAEITLDIDGKQSKGMGEGATLPEAVFTDDSGHNIAENIWELLTEIGAAGDTTVGQALD